MSSSDRCRFGISVTVFAQTDTTRHPLYGNVVHPEAEALRPHVRYQPPLTEETTRLKKLLLHLYFFARAPRRYPGHQRLDATLKDLLAAGKAREAARLGYSQGVAAAVDEVGEVIGHAGGLVTRVLGELAAEELTLGLAERIEQEVQPLRRTA